MEQEDYIKKMFDQMARILGNSIAKILNVQQLGLLSDGVESIKENLKIDANIDIDYLLTISNEEFINELKNKGVTDSNIELVSKILFEMGEREIDKVKQRSYFDKVKFLLEYLSATDKTFSIERQKHIQKINSCYP